MNFSDLRDSCNKSNSLSSLKQEKMPLQNDIRDTDITLKHIHVRTEVLNDAQSEYVHFATINANIEET